MNPQILEPLDLVALRGSVLQAILSNEDGKAGEAAQRFESIHEQIVHSGDDRPAVLEQHARTLLGLSASRLDLTGDVAASLDLLAQAEQAAERADARHLRAAVRGQRGLFMLRLGDVDGALAALDSAAELIDDAEPFDQIRILLNRGALYMERGSLAQARADLGKCARIASEDGDTLMEHKARHNLGYVEFLAGNIPRALGTLADAARLHEGGPHPIMLLDKARILREGGLTADAEDTLADASRLFLEGGLFQDLGETELARAECALAQGDPGRARDLAKSSARRFAKRDNTRWRRKAELVIVQATRIAIGGDLGGAGDRALSTLAGEAAALAGACAEEGRVDLARQAGLIEAEARLSANPSAEVEAVGTERAGLHRGDAMSIRLQTRAVRARLAVAGGDPARGKREIRKGLAELGSYQSRFGSLELRTASAVHGVALARLDLGLAVDTGRASAVFASIERSRSVSTRLAGVQPPTDAETADLLAELRQVEEEVRSLEGDAGAAASAARLHARSAALQQSVRERAWVREGSPSAAGSVVGIGDLRASLRDEGAAFVSYVRHGADWLAVLVTSGRSRMLPLVAADEVDELVRRVRADLDALAMPRLPDPLRDSVERSLEIGLARLDETLVAPLRVEGTPLVVSPSGPLVVLPWSLLPSRRGLPLVLAPSGSAWMKARGGSRSGRAPKVAVVAGPGLNRADTEASSVHRTWAGSSLLAGEQATTGRVAAALAEADVVHIAAHGTHQQDSPLFSSVRLADGPLYAYELDADTGIAGFVVLSACEAGLSTVGPGDEGLGLTSVLLHLGAHSVLAGVAQVRDDIAAELMERVHHSMKRGADSAAALAAAQADCAAPTPFVCFGSTWRS